MSLAIGIRLCRVPWQIDTAVSDSVGGTTLTVGDTATFGIAAIRELLRHAFTQSDLRRFCHDRPACEFIAGHLGTSLEGAC